MLKRLMVLSRRRLCRDGLDRKRNNQMFRYHLHTGMCNCTDDWNWNSRNQMIGFLKNIVGLNRISEKLLMSLKDHRTELESVNHKRRKRM